MMAGIRATDTRPELLLRKGLHALGFRFRIHVGSLPGKPDLVLPRWRAVIFAHGCFWHGHDCPLFVWPKTRPDFWRAKIERNREVDARAEAALAEAGWRHAVVWECALRGRIRLGSGEAVRRCAEWLRSGVSQIMIEGHRP
jgi:DNA mismatch endonuclease (patch repair protein)